MTGGNRWLLNRCYFILMFGIFFFHGLYHIKYNQIGKWLIRQHICIRAQYVYTVVVVSFTLQLFKRLITLSMYFLSRSLSCTKNCNPARINEDTKIEMECKINDQCSQVVWHIEDPRNDGQWPVSALKNQ